MSKKKTLPKELLVYVFDEDSETGDPLYAVAQNVAEISEDCHGKIVGNYVLNKTSTFRVKRELT